jgi:hypothetical protein
MLGARAAVRRLTVNGVMRCTTLDGDGNSEHARGRQARLGRVGLTDVAARRVGGGVARCDGAPMRQQRSGCCSLIGEGPAAPEEEGDGEGDSILSNVERWRFAP